MGQMRFHVVDRQNLPADAVERAYFTGMDEIPWRSRTQWIAEHIVVQRAECDSGNFHIPWNVPGYGELSLSTACLMEKTEPYQLAVELARGTIHRLRNQLATWQSSGIQFGGGGRLPLLSKALEHLAKAVTSQHQPQVAETAAQQAIVAALDCMTLLSRLYSENALTLRRKQQSRPTVSLGVNLGSAPFNETVQRYVVNTFNTSIVPIAWAEVESQEGRRNWSLPDRQVEWSRANHLKVVAGPLIQLDRAGLPAWSYLYEGDTPQIQNTILDYVEAVVERYKGRVNVWECAARLNVEDSLGMDEGSRLRLIARAINTVHTADPETPIAIAIDQPWGEFMRQQDCDFSPFHFADTLVRANLGLSALNLEINLGYTSNSTLLRDLFDFLRQIDRWSTLGLSLFITLTMPSSVQPDAKAKSHSQAIPFSNGNTMPQAQAKWIEQLVPLLLAKPFVQGVFWNQLLDGVPHELPNAGLFDANHQPKPVAIVLREIQQKFLS